MKHKSCSWNSLYGARNQDTQKGIRIRKMKMIRVTQKFLVEVPKMLQASHVGTVYTIYNTSRRMCLCLHGQAGTWSNWSQFK
jgi:hypothetical protein